MKSFQFALLTLLTFCILSKGYEYNSSCSCPQWNRSFPNRSVNHTPSSPSVLLLSKEEEVFNGTFSANIISFSRNVWLAEDIRAERNTISPRVSCPAGYRIPTGAELRSLLNNSARASQNSTRFLLDPAGFALNSSLTYVSSEKTNPQFTSGQDNRAWMFTALFFQNRLSFVQSVNTFNLGNRLAVRCVLNTTTPPSLRVEGLTSREFHTNIDYNLTLKKSNVLSQLWEVNGENRGSGQILSWRPSRPGCHVVSIHAVLFGGIPQRKCLILWADLFTGSEADTKLDIRNLRERTYTDMNVSLVNDMHFKSGSAPFAPKKDRGAFILFARSGDLALHVRVVNYQGDNIGTPISLSKFGYPLDITSTPWGFVSLIVDRNDTNKLYLLGNYENGTFKFQTTIMNNGENPRQIRDQIRFYDNKGNLVYGMNAMFKPHNGRLSFIRNRIHCIFAHYNHFGLYPDRKRNDHTGDTHISFDENGQNIRLVWGWGASHSLIQSMITTGNRVVTASLGDAFPQQIRFSVSNIDATREIDSVTKLANRVNSTSNNSLISGNIPGNGAGKSCGNLGGLSILKASLILGVYTRKSCNISFGGKRTINNNSEVGVVGFDQRLNKQFETKIADGSRVHLVKSVKYGRNLLVGIGRVNSTSADFLPTRISPQSDTMTLLLVDPQGVPVGSEVNVTKFSLSPADDWRVMSDGTIGWTYVDQGGKLNFYTVPLGIGPRPSVDETSLVDSFGESLPSSQSQAKTGRKRINLKAFRFWDR